MQLEGERQLYLTDSHSKVDEADGGRKRTCDHQQPALEQTLLWSPILGVWKCFVVAETVRYYLVIHLLLFLLDAQQDPTFPTFPQPPAFCPAATQAGFQSKTHQRFVQSRRDGLSEAQQQVLTRQP